jgi:hypothetical protein
VGRPARGHTTRGGGKRSRPGTLARRPLVGHARQPCAEARARPLPPSAALQGTYALQWQRTPGVLTDGIAALAREANHALLMTVAPGGNGDGDVRSWGPGGGGSGRGPTKEEARPAPASATKADALQGSHPKRLARSLPPPRPAPCRA